MQIIFTRKSERDCTIQCRCDGGRVLAVRPPSRQKGLPHDLAHYVVERELGVAWGFWGLIAHGATFHSVTHCSGPKRLHADEVGRRLLNAYHEHLSGAEMLVTVLVQIWQGAREIHHKETQAALAQASHRADVTMDRDAMRRACEGLTRMETQWLSLDWNQSLTVDWPIFSPRRQRGDALVPRRRRARRPPIRRLHSGRLPR